MVALTALWLPILLAAFFVFAASSMIHMFLPYHRTDFGKVPDEDALMDALGPIDLPPGDFVVPHAGGDPEVMKSEEFREKARRGPVMFMTVLPKGDPFAMGTQLTLWFLYCLLMSAVAAYMASRAVPVGGDYLEVFRFAGTTAFAAYALALPQRSIWFKTSWSTTAKSMFDGLIYALLTAGTFGWLWPM
ncbi:MAG: hypothetical protein RJQ04_19200 [Longimicrobiales bacterium]